MDTGAWSDPTSHDPRGAATWNLPSTGRAAPSSAGHGPPTRRQPRPTGRAAAVLACGHATELSAGQPGPFAGSGIPGACAWVGKGAPSSRRGSSVSPPGPACGGEVPLNLYPLPALWLPLPDVTSRALPRGLPQLCADAPSLSLSKSSAGPCSPVPFTGSA